MSVNWEQLGGRLIERDWRPLAIVDRSGRILRANSAFRFLTSDKPQSNFDWLAERSRDELASALASLKSASMRVTVSLASTTMPMDVVLDLEACDARSALVAVVDYAPHSGLPLLPVNGVLYEVVLREGRPAGVVRRLPGSDHGAHLECWAQIFGRSTECPDCPVRGLASGKRASGVVPSERSADLHVVAAEKLTDNQAIVSAWTLERSLFARLVSARVAVLAQRAGLTERERALFELLLHGQTVEEAAGELGITAHTVKYHQQNLLRKLGADSRLELFSQLL